MKSFGVRLAAGIVTIVFGAYAAAVAQKDKQNDPQAWTAQAPSLGDPAMPIAGINEESWISQPTAGDPARELTELAASAFGATDQSEHEVALVQFNEDIPTGPVDEGPSSREPLEQSSSFDVSSLPASLGEPPTQVPSFEAPQDLESRQSTELAVPVPDWTREGASAPNTMAFPTSELAALDAHPAESQSEPPMQSEPAPFAFAQVPEVDAEPTRDPAFTAQTDFTQPSNELRSATTQPMAMPSFGASAPAQLAQNSPAFTQPPGSHAIGSQPSGSIRQTPAPNFAQTLPSPTSPSPMPSAMQQPAPTFPRAIPARSPSMNPERMASLPGQNLGDAANRGHSSQTVTDTSQVFDAPGDRRLDGMQSPSIVIQKRAPPEVKVGKPAAFAIHVQNVGGTDALGVKVHDRIPAGMRLVDAVPAPIQQGNLLLWELGTMRAGEERTVTMKLVPEAEGELGSVARVTFEAAASVRTRSTRPELKVVQNAPNQVLIGQQLEIELEVSNPGTGEATAVSLQEDVPDGLEHPRGRQLDNLLGNLAPGEVRRQVLRLRAVSPGRVTNTIRLVSEDGIQTEDSINVEVIAPNVQVDLVGPSKRFLERQATYELQVANLGTADATNVEISVGLDRGFTFVSTDNEGSYDPSRHTITWSLAQLPAGINAKVPLTLLPVEEGNRALTIDARADLGVVARAERMVLVEGLAELSFQITNPGGPIELGAESTYEIVVVNEGSKADSNVQVQAQLPQGIELISAEGSGNQAQSDGRGLVAFMPLNQLAPGDQALYRIRARGIAPGSHLIRAVVISDASPTAVTKEESTLVYADQ